MYPNVYKKISSHLQSITQVLGAPNRLGLVSYSPVESINNMLILAQRMEPSFHIEQFLISSIKQWNKQSNFVYEHANEKYLIFTKSHEADNRENLTVIEIEDGKTYHYSIHFNTNKISCSCGLPDEILLSCHHVVSV